MKRLANVLLSVAMAAYLGGALLLTTSMAANEPCAGVDIVIADTAAHPFVTVTELNRDLGDLAGKAPGMRLADINTAEIEARLGSIDKIEHAKALRLSDGRVRIEVTPMRPVCRVFDGDRSYYINKDGKRMSANARYHVDVPVVVGRLDRLGIKPEALLPLIAYIEKNPTWSALTSSIYVKSANDIVLVPVIHGHVVNLGSAEGLDDKFDRLQTFYTKVLPYKGWEAYDTISVKWRGQVVATRAQKGLNDLPDIDEDIDEADDAVTMLPTDNALAGAKADDAKKDAPTLKIDSQPEKPKKQP